MIRRPPRSTRVRSSAASDVYKRQVWLQARQRRTRHSRASALPRPQEHPAHCALHGACAGSLQELLAGLRAGRVTGLARVREQEFVPAGVAVDAGKAVARVATCDEKGPSTELIVAIVEMKR